MPTEEKSQPKTEEFEILLAKSFNPARLSIGFELCDAAGRIRRLDNEYYGLVKRDYPTSFIERLSTRPAVIGRKGFSEIFRICACDNFPISIILQKGNLPDLAIAR